MISTIKKRVTKHRDHVRSTFYDLTHTTQHSLHAISLGFAVGSFISSLFLPIPWLHLLIALVVILVFPRIHKLALFAAMLFWSPLFIALHSYIGYRLGALLIEGEHLTFSISSLHKLWVLVRYVWLANVIIGAAFAIGVYFAVRAIIRWYRHKNAIS